MSFPNVPNITPEISLKRKDAINLLLTSIAMEELAISHVLNAEAEKLQHVIKMEVCFEELMKTNASLERVIKTLIKKEMLLQFKLENIMDLQKEGEDFCEEFPEE